MNEIKIKKCIVCGEEFKYNTHGRNHSSDVGKRRKDCITCSKKCSRIYARISIYLRGKKKW